MLRAVLVASLLVLAVAGTIVYQAAARQRSYETLLARGDAALRADQTFAAAPDPTGELTSSIASTAIGERRRSRRSAPISRNFRPRLSPPNGRTFRASTSVAA